MTPPPNRSPQPTGKGTFVIWYHLIDGGTLSTVHASAWAVLTCLIRHADRQGRCYPTEARLCTLTGLGRTTVSKAIQTLIRLELISVVKEAVGNRSHPRNHYEVHLPVLSVGTERRLGYVRVRRDFIDSGVIDYVGVSAWAVYTAILRHMDQEQRCFPSEQTLVSLTGLSRNTVISCIKRLRVAGLVTVHKVRHANARYPHNTYHVNSQSEIASQLIQRKRMLAETSQGLVPKSEHGVVQILGSKKLHLRSRACPMEQGTAESQTTVLVNSPTSLNPVAAKIPPQWGFSSLGLEQSREEQVRLRLCLHLGGEAEVVDLFETQTPSGIPRRRYLKLSLKGIEKALREVAKNREATPGEKIALLIEQLDHQISHHVRG